MVTMPNGETLAFSPAELRKVAEALRLLIWSIVATLIAFVPHIGAAYLLVYLFQLWATYSLGTALKFKNVWLWVLGTMVPCVGLFILLRMNSKATKMLQSAGVPVGLMGAKMDQLPQ